MQVYEPYMYIYIHAMQNNIIIKYCAIDLTRYRCLCIVTHIHIHSHTHVTHHAYLLVDTSIVAP